MNNKHFPRLVGIVGYARAGKDSCGKVLVDFYGYERVALADPLKDFALASNPLLHNSAHDWFLGDESVCLADVVSKYGWEAAKDLFPSARAALVRIGTAAREVFGIDFWVRMALERAIESFVVEAQYRPTVFTDIRFLNEAAALRAADPKALLLRVDRPGVGPASDFEREVAEIDVDGVINNGGTLEDLDFEVRKAFLDALILRGEAAA